MKDILTGVSLFTIALALDWRITAIATGVLIAGAFIWGLIVAVMMWWDGEL